MTKEKQFGGLDYFKMAAAFLVIAIHTSPLASFSAEGDFIMTRVIARTAVPFFFMTTGCFLLPQYLFRRSMDYRPFLRSIKRHAILYLAGIFLYLPINIYAGQFEGLGIGAFFRLVLVDGTFYHLWYLPAAVLGIVIVWGIGRKLPFRGLLGISVILYLIGLFGDSYYGVAEQVPFLKKMYDMLFLISSYTRNGLFYAPLFLVMGAGIYHRRHRRNEAYLLYRKFLWNFRRVTSSRSEFRNASLLAILYRKHGEIVKSLIGFVLAMGLMTAEGLLLRSRDLQRHDSMYMMLPIVMFFLFQLLLAVRTMPVKMLREISMWIYLIHPFCIILVRGAAKAVHLERLFVENSLGHYLAVCAVSSAGALVITTAESWVRMHVRGFGRNRQIFAKGRAWIELSRENLVWNVKALQGLLSAEQSIVSGQMEPSAPGQYRTKQAVQKSSAPEKHMHKRLMAVVKADAYGHGAVPIAKEVQKMGIEDFATACVAEGVELRKNGIAGEILVLGYTPPEEFPLLRKYDLTQTVVDYAYGKLLNSYGKKIRVHVKIDTGMHRLGVRAEKQKEIGRIFRLKNLQVEGIYTHLCADETKSEEDQAFTKAQGELFYQVVRKLEKQGVADLKMHLLASYGLINYPALGGNYARVGIALYGLLSDEEAGRNCPVTLKPVLSLKAGVSLVKNLYQREYAGYGLDYEAPEDRKIAVLSIGYADGLPRSLSCGRGRVLIHGQSAPIIGRICMDQTIVDITGIEGVKAGDEAILIGKAGEEEITAYELAENAGTITNEILSRLGKRLGRIVV